MLATAIESEVSDWTEKHSHIVDDKGHRQVVRNGYPGLLKPERTIVTGVGDVQVEQPRVHDRRPEGQKKVINRGVNELNFAHKCVIIF